MAGSSLNPTTDSVTKFSKDLVAQLVALVDSVNCKPKQEHFFVLREV